MDEPLHFVVSATGPSATFWLGDPKETGLRSLVPRERAAVFPTMEDATAAVARMHQAFTSVGYLFSIEALRQSGG
jgi:hypothetical protein